MPCTCFTFAIGISQGVSFFFFNIFVVFLYKISRINVLADYLYVRLTFIFDAGEGT